MSELNIFLGPPGAGKGTQALKIASEFDLAHISTGDMLREHVSSGTELGKIAKSLLDEGNLVPDKLVIEMLLERLNNEDCKNGAILDGFPRTLPQAKSLESLDKEFPVAKVFVFEVNEDELIKRISDTLNCGILLISHDLHTVMTATDHVVCLNGHVCCSGSPMDVAKNNEYKTLFGEQASQILSVYEHKHDHVHSDKGEIKKN